MINSAFCENTHSFSLSLSVSPLPCFPSPPCHFSSLLIYVWLHSAHCIQLEGKNSVRSLNSLCSCLMFLAKIKQQKAFDDSQWHWQSLGKILNGFAWNMHASLDQQMCQLCLFECGHIFSYCQCMFNVVFLCENLFKSVPILWVSVLG